MFNPNCNKQHDELRSPANMPVVKCDMLVVVGVESIVISATVFATLAIAMGLLFFVTTSSFSSSSEDNAVVSSGLINTFSTLLIFALNPISLIRVVLGSEVEKLLCQILVKVLQTAQTLIKKSFWMTKPPL